LEDFENNKVRFLGKKGSIGLSTSSRFFSDCKDVKREMKKGKVYHSM
jgi:hypothetical protein